MTGSAGVGEDRGDGVRRCSFGDGGRGRSGRRGGSPCDCGWRGNGEGRGNGVGELFPSIQIGGAEEEWDEGEGVGASGVVGGKSYLPLIAASSPRFAQGRCEGATEWAGPF